MQEVNERAIEKAVASHVERAQAFAIGSTERYAAAVDFLKDLRVLEVEFANGGVYQYGDVSAEIFTGLLEAESVGRFFGVKVRGQFKAKKQDEEF